jgi:hypothetical protein
MIRVQNIEAAPAIASDVDTFGEWRSGMLLTMQWEVLVDDFVPGRLDAGHAVAVGVEIRRYDSIRETKQRCGRRCRRRNTIRTAILGLTSSVAVIPTVEEVEVRIVLSEVKDTEAYSYCSEVFSDGHFDLC